MTAQQESSEARLDDLRRRLYRADATEEDLRRFLDERPPEPEPEPPGPVPAGPPRRRARVVGGALAVLLVGGIVFAFVWSGQRTERATTLPGPTRTTVQDLRLEDIGDGQSLDVDAEAASGPTDVPLSIAGTDVVGERFQGYGNAVVAFDPPEGSFDGGRMLIAVTSTEPTAVDWRALLLVTRMDWTSYPIVLARGAAEDRRGAHAPTTFVYPSRPPTRIAVQAPAGVGWTLVVAVSDRIAPESR